MDGGYDPSQEPGGQPPEGTAPPQQPPDLETKNRELAAENQQLRAERRKDRAEALVERHKLPASVGDLLQSVPIDEMDARAQKIAEEMKASGTPPPPPTPPADPPAGQPPATPPVEPPTDVPNAGALGQFSGSEPGDPPTPPVSPDQALLKRLQEAKTPAEINAIQQEEIERRRRAELPQ